MNANTVFRVLGMQCWHDWDVGFVIFALKGMRALDDRLHSNGRPALKLTM